MKKTIFYICGKEDGRFSIRKDLATLLTEIQGLYELSSVVDKYINGETCYIQRVVDKFSNEGVIREVYLSK